MIDPVLDTSAADVFPVAPSVEPLLALAVLFILAILLIGTMIQYLFVSGRLASDEIRQQNRYRFAFIALVAAFALATGALGALLEITNILRKTGSAGVSLWSASLPLGDALSVFAVGIAVCMLGIVCMVIVLLRSTYLIKLRRRI